MMIWKLTEELELEVDKLKSFFQDLAALSGDGEPQENKDHWLAPEAKYEE